MLDAGIVDDRPFAALVTAYGKADLMNHVDQVLQTMESSGVEAGTVLFNTLINIHSKAEDPEKARAVLQLMQANGEFERLSTPKTPEGGPKKIFPNLYVTYIKVIFKAIFKLEK